MKPNFPPEAWEAIKTMFLLGISILTYLNNRHIKQVKRVVDGPLAEAVNNNAKYTRKIAELTGLKSDQTAATAAEAVQANRKEGVNRSQPEKKD